MTESGENSPISLTATGPVRLFPLPGLVMFPHVVQPLHIFEPRYCDMLEDSLADDHKIAMVLLQPGWERDYNGRPAIAPVACLGKVIAHERMPTGRHNILLRGLGRVAIRRELPPDRPFRQAEVELLEDYYPSSSANCREKMQRELIELARRLLPDSTPLHEQLDELLVSQASLGMLTDVFSFTLQFSATVKQRLLAECNVQRRASLLTQMLAALAQRQETEVGDSASEFPPRFSMN